MKTSKRILFTYIGALALAFLIFTIVISTYSKDHSHNHNDQYSNHIIELSDFSVINTTNQDLKLRKSGSTNLRVRYPKDSIPPTILWEIKGDTLILKSSKEYKQLTLNITDRQTLTLQIKDAQVWMTDLAVDTLKIKAHVSRIDGFKNCTINMLYANLTDSRFKAYNGNFNIVNVKLDKSNFTLNRKVKNITGNAINHSDARFKNTNKINMSFDDNSKLRFYP